jgi:PAS domain S-box-containing protein
MAAYSLLTFFSFLVYLSLALYSLRRDRLSPLNRVFSLLCASFALWALSSTAVNLTGSGAALKFWIALGAAGWCFFAGLFLHFILVLTGKQRLLRAKLAWAALYVPALFFFYLEVAEVLTVENYVIGSFGKIEVPPSWSAWYWVFIAYIFLCVFAGVAAAWLPGGTARSREIKQARVLTAFAFAVFIIIFLTDVILASLRISGIPPLAPVLTLFWVAGVWRSIARHSFLREITTLAQGDIINHMKDLLLILNPDGVIITINRAVRDLLGTKESGILGRHLSALMKNGAGPGGWFETFSGSGDNEFEIETTLAGPSGAEIPVSLTVSRVCDSDGDVVALVAIAHDLSRNRLLKQEMKERILTEGALRESEEMFREITDNITDLIAIVDTRGVYRYVSPSHEAVMGYTRQELTGTPFFDLMHQDDVPKAYQLFHRGAGTLSTRHAEIRIASRSGEYRWYDVMANIIPDEEGGVRNIVISCRDISEKIAARRAVIDSEEKYRTILHEIEEGFFEVDLDGNFIFSNPALRDMIGYPGQEIMGMNYRQYMDAGNAKKVFATFNRIFRTGESTSAFNWELIAKDGRVISVETSISLVRDREGGPRGFRGMVRDVTERKAVENRLLESEERYRTLTENSSDIICEVDRQGRYIYISSNIREKLGYEPGELLGKTFFDFIHPQEIESAKKAWSQKQSQFILRFRHSNGTWRWFDIAAKKFTQPGGQERIVCISRDITERKLEEERLWENEMRLRLQQMALAELAKHESLHGGNLIESFKIINRVGCHNLDVDRCGIWLFDEDRKSLKCYDHYDVRDNSHIEGRVIDISGDRRFFSLLEELRLLDADDMAREEGAAGFIESFYPDVKIHTLLAVAFRLAGETVGILIFDQAAGERKWTQEEKRFAASLADFASLAMETHNRKLAEEALRISEEMLRRRTETIDKDLKNAQIIQRALLPDRIPAVERIKLDFRNYSVDEVGGDYFSFTPLQEGGLGIFIGDVSGHGVSAALFLSLLKATADRACRRYGQNPREFIETLNHDLIENMPHYFVTAIYGYFGDFNGANGNVSFTFSKGGHPNPIIHRAASGRVEMLNCRGTILGKFEHVSYEEQKVELSRGDRIFLYTDGLPETSNDQNSILGFNELLPLIQRVSTSDLSGTLDAILESANDFRGNAAIEDDIVLIGCEVR